MGVQPPSRQMAEYIDRLLISYTLQNILDASENKETGKADMENIAAQKERPELSKGRRYVYAGIFWFFAIGTLYTVLFVSWRGMLGPLILLC